MRVLLWTANADPETTLRIAAARIQAIGAEVPAALIAAQQAFAAHALLAVMTDGNLATLNQVQFAPIDERRSAAEIQRNHGKSIETWKLLPVAHP